MNSGFTKSADSDPTAPEHSDLEVCPFFSNINHSILVDSFTVICWTSPFVISGVSCLFCRFILFC